jgi:hypothetical protein
MLVGRVEEDRWAGWVGLGRKVYSHRTRECGASFELVDDQFVISHSHATAPPSLAV